MTKRSGKKRATKPRPCNDAPGGDERRRLAAHRARCGICKHPEREEIEREFLDWVSPREIAEGWKIPSYRAIYRHAHAVGLFERRRKNWLAAIDSIIERVREVPVTASAVVAAIRLSRELEGEQSGDGGLRPGQKFLLSLEGLPRTNAVTGNAHGGGGTVRRTCGDTAGRGALQCAPTGEETVGRGDPPGRPPATEASCNEPGGQGDRLKPVPPRRRDVAPTSGGEADPDLAKAPAGVAPDGAHPAAAKADPRVALSEDGRVAGIPRPKGKITFARGRRWRPGRRGP